jgi:hypothetical protein
MYWPSLYFLGILFTHGYTLSRGLPGIGFLIMLLLSPLSSLGFTVLRSMAAILEYDFIAMRYSHGSNALEILTITISAWPLSFLVGFGTVYTVRRLRQRLKPKAASGADLLS